MDVFNHNKPCSPTISKHLNLNETIFRYRKLRMFAKLQARVNKLRPL